MGVPCSWPTAVSAIGPTAVGSLLWDNHGQLHLSVVVKARFALRHDAPMLIARAPSLDERDVHQGDDPTRSLVRASDIVPYRPMADIWLTGHAYAPGGRAVTVSVVRLALYRGREALLDKVVHVLGDRSVSNAVPESFTKMPLVYERAYGGAGFDDNPVGVGADERPLLPNIVHPDHAERAACLGPVSRYWKVRRGTLDTNDRRLVEQEVPALPQGFDWGYFQAAPPDQRVPFLRGDEWLVLDGLHPTMLRIQSRLPKARGLARVFSLRGDDRGDAIAMVADTLAIDADAQTCAITWRGNFALESRDRLDDILVAGGAELAGRNLDWSKARENAVAAPRRRPSQGRLADPGATVVGSGDELDSTRVDVDRPSAPTLPTFEIGSEEELPSGTYQRLEVDSGEWSVEAWPEFPLGADGDEVTETKTRADAFYLRGDERPTQIEQPGIPLAVDTEPGAPPEVVEDELPWITEVAVEPEPEEVEPESEQPENTEVMRRPTPPRPTPPRPRRPPPPRPPQPPKHVSDMRSRAASMPPAPMDLAAYETSLRRAGASEEDIARLLEGLRRDGGLPSSD